ncbi:MULTISPECIES: baeRF2 domain-containing protein [Kitasatospora]|uniref:Vms1/Ankzf1 family peptidyl-tRNA hydrolase n=1 Tax=Kitasatospora cystarginea TaxID=58350 RepID=A0ABN3DS12_9ACTN
MELAFLSPLLAGPLPERAKPWASVYLDTSRATEDAVKQQDLRRRAVARQLADQGADEPTRAAVDGTLAAAPVSGTPAGRALFATEGSVVLDVPLEAAPAMPEATWSALPHLAPLLTLRGEDTACLVALIDRTGADLELRDGRANGHSRARVRLGSAEGEQWQDRGHRSVPADRYGWHYEQRLQDTWDQTAQVIADELTRRWPDSGARLLVLAGDARERRAVHNRLPDWLQPHAVEVDGGARTAGASSEALDRRIAEAKTAYRTERLDDALDQFHAGRGRPGEHGASGPDSSPGPAAEGIPAVLDAARRHQVATLLLDESAGDPGRQVWVGPGPDQLASRRTDAHALGVARPQPARADDALLRAAAAAGAEAVLVPTEAGGPAGGVGAVLRWSD